MQNSKKSIKKKLDKLCSEIVRARGGCEICFKTEHLQCAHIYPRTIMSLRWDMDNLLCLCYRCHFHFAHKHPLAFTEFIKKHFGTKHIKSLEKKSQKLIHYTLDDLIEMYNKLLIIQNGIKEYRIML